MGDKSNGCGWDSEDEDWDNDKGSSETTNKKSTGGHQFSYNARVPDQVSFGRRNHDYFDGLNDNLDGTKINNHGFEKRNDYDSRRGERNQNRDFDNRRRDFGSPSRSFGNQRREFHNPTRDYDNSRSGYGSSTRNYDNPRRDGDDFRRENDGSNQRRKTFDRRRRNNDPPDAVEIMTIQSRDCGRIIGKGGSKIRELQEDSGAHIKVCNEEDEDDKVPVTISGTAEAVAKAQKLIQELIDEANMYRRPPVSRADDAQSKQSKEKFMVNGSIDWGKVIAQADKERDEHWAKFPKIVKDFYIENDDVADMTNVEVSKWRDANFNLAVADLSTQNRQPLNPILTFEQAFAHYPEILTEIYKQGFVKPSPIQSQVWPLALRGHDVIGIAQTGTGKTLAFLLPAFVHIDQQSIPREDRKGPSALVLTPTRELALQIEMEIKKYTYRGIRCVCVYGGGDRKKQVKMVMSGVEIIVATPGRFNDLLDCGIITLENITFLVLDEADRMLDMGFEPQIMKILIDIRPDRQTLMTSATWPSGVRRLAQSYMVDPFQVNVGSLDLAATHTVKQIIEIIDEEDKRQRLYEFLSNMEGEDKVLVFVGKKATCDDVSADLALRNIVCQSIHGGREQYDREQALDDFKISRVRILIATDVASRGLDVKDITHVFNFDYPRNTEEYVHRVGRTGRAGRTGTSISLVTRSDWGSAKELIDILEEAQQEVPLELYEMAERFEKMKERRGNDRSGFRGGRRGRGGGGRGFGGGNRPRW